MHLWDLQGRPVPAGRSGFPVDGGGDWKSSTYKLESSCPSGSQIYLWAPYAMVDVHLTGQEPIRFIGRWNTHRAVMQKLGPAPRGGKFTAWVRVHERGSLDPGGIGCLDPKRLAAAEQRLAAGAATQVHVTSDGISAQLPPGSTGYAVVATPAITGRSCSTSGGGASKTAQSYLGLLSVPLDGRATGISCSFTPPGLHAGEAVGGASLLGVLGVAGFGWWRTRRRPGTAEGDDDASEEAAVAALADNPAG
jgi:hypothetical protein